MRQPRCGTGSSDSTAGVFYPAEHAADRRMRNPLSFYKQAFSSVAHPPSDVPAISIIFRLQADTRVASGESVSVTIDFVDRVDRLYSLSMHVSGL